jgi:glutaredoxin 3
MASIVVHSKPGCPYCDRAKDFLKHKELAFVEKMYDPHDSAYEEQKTKLIQKTNWKTFPQIYIGNEFIGGYNDLVHLYNTMKLHEICKKELDIQLATHYDF